MQQKVTTKMKNTFSKTIGLLFIFISLNGQAQNALEIYRTKSSDKENVRESYFLLANHEAKVVTELFTYNGLVQQVADTFLMIDSQKISYNLIRSIAFKKSDAAYRKQKWTGAAITIPAVAFASLFAYSLTNNNKNGFQSCFGGIGSLLFVPAALIWGIPMLFNSKSTFDLYNNKWQMNLVKKN